MDVLLCHPNSPFRECLDQCDRYNRHAPREPILITGETGTGKELIAWHIHFNGPRRTGPIFQINCAAVCDTLFESELFGHEKGAFTNATERHIGLYESAHTGTLFLDEIGDLPAHLQSKLNRALDGYGFYRLGGSELIKPDVRIICATNRNLLEMVGQGRFNNDFYARIAVLAIAIPPLRDRPDDIRVIALGLAQQRGCAIDDEAIGFLLKHPFPRNIRQLREIIINSGIRALDQDGIIRLADVEQASLCVPACRQSDVEACGPYGPWRPYGAHRQSDIESNARPPVVRSLADIEKGHIQSVYQECNHNKERAARILRVSLTCLRGRLKKYHITDPTK
jgi:transcriptional regulator with PAS, ATPase and Fis domain